MEPNVKLIDDPFLADEIMFVVDQIAKCGTCKFATCIGGGSQHQSVICTKGMCPYGVEDGCDSWRPRRS